MAEMDQITLYDCHFGPMTITIIKSDESQTQVNMVTEARLHMGVTPRPRRVHLMVTVRSNQVKMGKNRLFLCSCCAH